jgi:hypothetical protein
MNFWNQYGIYIYGALAFLAINFFYIFTFKDLKK